MDKQEKPAPVEPAFLNDLRQWLRPLTDWIPAEVREIAPVEVWWLFYLVALLVVLLLVGTILKAVGKKLFSRRRREHDYDEGWREELEECPMPLQPPGERALAVYHIPVRIRLVVLAPMGKELDITEKRVPELLDRVFPELGRVVAREEPRIRIWPSQLSPQGFIAAFHRRSIKPEASDEPSRWILVAGRALLGKKTLLLALALYSEQPCSIGRLNLEPNQWLETLRLISV